MEQVEAFWSNVKAQIKTQNTTQEWIAKESGVSFHTLQGWISKGVFPRADESVKIARALKTTVEYLVTGEAPKDLSSAKLETARKLLDEAREVLK